MRGVPDYETLSLTLEDGVLTVTLDRPDRLNAFTLTMGRELTEAFRAADADDDVAAVVVTGRGRAFCAGMDLSTSGNPFGVDPTRHLTMHELRTHLHTDELVAGVRDEGGKLTLAIDECRKPVLAAVNGPAVGVGATMLCAMDVRLISQDASVAFVFGKIGIVPEAISSYFLPRIVGLPRALEWMYTAQTLEPEELMQAGFARSVHPAEDLLGAAHSLARRFTEHRSPAATALTRRLLRRNATVADPVEAHLADSLAMAYTSTRDGLEGVSAFLEKRTPRFTSKVSELPPAFPWG
ncbi:enoyl-CoA hydratase [Intrasporangium chromatireducens Q5-1]|uniref:Enoyl-CoA hydratase n=1 Tax=Intrasporangium chromatireducens Q5-1 TaxID=584657 RepID=W9GM69_9MICO|nr:enoyl-CoA hydratase-related protein [Intrasporangium chromatireducens]EWT04984.1 enoyl-CoA hydratase [Intrasporangium chromatireducens Q5-1]